MVKAEEKVGSDEGYDVMPGDGSSEWIGSIWFPVYRFLVLVSEVE